MSARADVLRFAHRSVRGATAALDLFSKRLRHALENAATAVRRLAPELLVAGALVIGWTLLTWGIAALTAWQAYPISAGVLLLSLCGWRFLAQLFGDGLYLLTRDRKDRR